MNRPSLRQTSEKGIRLITAFEGFRAQVYLCSANYWTIGIGHMIRAFDKNRDTRKRMFNNPYPAGVDRREAELILQKDLAVAERAVIRLVMVPLTDGQFDALVSFVFNLGAGNFQRSTLRMKVNREDHEHVTAEFMKWVYSGGRKERGLIRRRAAEALLYQSGMVTDDLP